jgi:hypothetical protein
MMLAILIVIPAAITAILVALMPNDSSDDDKDNGKNCCKFILMAIIGLVWFSYFSPLVIGLAYYGLQYRITTLLIRYGADSYTLFNSVIFCMIRTFTMLFFLLNLWAG